MTMHAGPLAAIRRDTASITGVMKHKSRFILNTVIKKYQS